MLSKPKIRKIVLLILLFWYSVELAQAGEQIVLNPVDGHSNQNQINEALSQADEVYLKSGVYKIDDSIFIDSDTILRGDPDAIIQVYEGSDQFFTGMKGLICSNGPVDDILIEGFQIDGNCDELNPSYSRSAPQYDHDAERAIIINGYTNRYCNNIVVRNMQIFDCFSDGVHVRFANSVFVYDNFISNCQHEGVFFVCVELGKIYGNKIAGVTSDCVRLDNCVSCRVYENILFSYRGSNSNGAYQGGQNGIQVANAGSSHGYDASNKPTKTTNVEVFNNVFANDIPNAIWVHSLDESQVYLHDNRRIDGSELADMGIPLEGIDFNNMPSKEMSEKVFDSIFDILEWEFTDSGRTDQTAEDVPLQVAEKSSGIIAGGVKIVGFKDRIVLDNVSYIPDDQAVLAQTKVIQNPDFSQWAGIIKQIDKKVSVKIENGTAYAKLTVKTHWYTKSTNSLTGKSSKSKIRTATATFKDSVHPAPEILTREKPAKAYVNVFSDTKNPIAKVKAYPTNATQRIEYTYRGNTTTRTFLIGERITDKTGLQYTAYYRCDAWAGTIPHMGNELILVGKFDPAQLHIKYYTPYESSEIEDIEIIYHKTEGENPLITTLKFLVQMIMAMYAGYRIMIIIIN